jgi:hypothetical protein
LQPDRQWSLGGYRYGFNGQEHTSEVGDNNYTAQFWEYDSRTGRRWNLDPKPIDGVSQYSTFYSNPIRYSDRLGDTLSGINNASATEQKNIIHTVFNQQNRVKALFQLGADGKTFNQIKRDAFLDALDAESSSISGELRDIAWGYFNVVNQSNLYEISFLQSTDASPAVGLDSVKHASYISFINSNLPTMGDFDRLLGRQATLPTNNHKYLVIQTSDINPMLNDYVRWGKYVPQASSKIANNIHELLGHAWPYSLGVATADAIESIQMENIYYRAIGHPQRDGTDHQNGVLLNSNIGASTPVQLNGNRERRLSVKDRDGINLFLYEKY